MKQHTVYRLVFQYSKWKLYRHVARGNVNQVGDVTVICAQNQHIYMYADLVCSLPANMLMYVVVWLCMLVQISFPNYVVLDVSNSAMKVL